MDERAISEAAGHVTSAAAQFERLVLDVLQAFREGQFDPAPVGSPAYVQRLRDRAAVASMQATLSRADVPIGTAPSQVAEWALGDADALVKVLGYEPPGEEKP